MSEKCDARLLFSDSFRSVPALRSQGVPRLAALARSRGWTACAAYDRFVPEERRAADLFLMRVNASFFEGKLRPRLREGDWIRLIERTPEGYRYQRGLRDRGFLTHSACRRVFGGACLVYRLRCTPTDVSAERDFGCMTSELSETLPVPAFDAGRLAEDLCAWKLSRERTAAWLGYLAERGVLRGAESALAFLREELEELGTLLILAGLARVRGGRFDYLLQRAERAAAREAELGTLLSRSRLDRACGQGQIGAKIV